MSSSTQHRQPAGVPVGGQFAATQRSSAEVTLGDYPWGGHADEPGCPFTGCGGGPDCLEHAPDDRMVGRVLQVVADAVRAADASNEYVDHEQLISDRLGVDVHPFGDEITRPLIHALATDDAGTAYRAGGYLADIAEREQRCRNHPAWREPGTSVERDNDYYGPVTRGENYDPDRPLREVAKDVRADIKAAVEAGYLPELDYKVRVRTKGVSAIDVRAEGMPHLLARTMSDRYPDAEAVSGVAQQVEQRLQQILASYNRTQSATHADYWNHAFYADVRLLSDVEARYANASEAQFGAWAKVRKGTMTPDEYVRIQDERDAAHQAGEQASLHLRQAWSAWNADLAA